MYTEISMSVNVLYVYKKFFEVGNHEVCLMTSLGTFRCEGRCIVWRVVTHQYVLRFKVWTRTENVYCNHLTDEFHIRVSEAAKVSASFFGCRNHNCYFNIARQSSSSTISSLECCRGGRFRSCWVKVINSCPINIDNNYHRPREIFSGDLVSEFGLNNFSAGNCYFECK